VLAGGCGRRNALLGVWLCLISFQAWATGLQTVDDRGVTVSLPAVPQRIVSLLPSLTETVCALGQCHRLVGVDRYSNWPASLDGLPRLGGGLDPNVEAIVALRPDLVLMARSSRMVERLSSLGLKVVTLEPRNHADVQRVLAQVAGLLGVSAARTQNVWRGIETGVAAVAQSLPPRVKMARVYVEVNRGPYAAGPTSFVGETLGRLGAQNIVPASLGPFPLLNPEFVVRANPDVILVADSDADGWVRRPGWAGIRAVREQRLCVLSREEGDVVVRPGPRMAEAARLMARCLQEKAP
jgi:iron complex transport system substrate-binding protein